MAPGGPWQVIENLGIVRNRSLIVSGTKALHHVLPGLVPPMDRAWTAIQDPVDPVVTQNGWSGTVPDSGG